jgi:GR25 family glycosyltransferase involved in LPS biosynthesis
MTQPNQTSYLGLYINLDRSTDRRKRLETQLHTFGLESHYQRFSGIDGRTTDLRGSSLKPGEVGAFLSHCQALEQLRGLGKCVHIIEDDVLLSEHVKPVIDDAIAGNLFYRYDLLFTDLNVNCNIGLIKNLSQVFERFVMPPVRPIRFKELVLMELNQVFFAAFQSLVVGEKSIDRVTALYRQELANGPKTPVDIFIKNAVLKGQLRAVCVFPFVTSLRLEDHMNSTIAAEGERSSEPSIMVMAILRYLFFLGRDLSYAEVHLDAALKARTPPNRMHKLLVQAVDYVMSNDFKES